MQEEELKFQRYAHDKILGKGRSPSEDSSPGAKKRVILSPRTYHENTTDKTLEWELEQAIDSLKDLLL